MNHRISETLYTLVSRRLFPLSSSSYEIQYLINFSAYQNLRTIAWWTDVSKKERARSSRAHYHDLKLYRWYNLALRPYTYTLVSNFTCTTFYPRVWCGRYGRELVVWGRRNNCHLSLVSCDGWEFITFAHCRVTRLEVTCSLGL